MKTKSNAAALLCTAAFCETFPDKYALFIPYIKVKLYKKYHPFFYFYLNGFLQLYIMLLKNTKLHKEGGSVSIESRSNQYGTVFEHWQIKEMLGHGSGGKTAVFLLSRNDSFQEFCALKVINLIEEQGSLEDLPAYRRNEYLEALEECKQRATPEVRMMLDLRGSSNVVDYLDHKFVSWCDASGFGCDLLIRMELLTDLRSVIKKGKLFEEAEILKLGKDICSALMLCHENNILHRDIKPENIFLNKRGDYKLGDFGISRILRDSPMSKATTGIGTPEYAAPEQFNGKHDRRVDIYSLGLVLYELSNQNMLPFASSSYARQEDIMKRQSGLPFPTPAASSARLWDVVRKACAFDPADRYQTAQEFMDALCRLDGFAAASGNASPSGYDTAPASGSSGGYETTPANRSSNGYKTVPANIPSGSYDTEPAYDFLRKSNDPSGNRSRDTVHVSGSASDAVPSGQIAIPKWAAVVGIALVLVLGLLLIPKPEDDEPAETDPSESTHMETTQSNTQEEDPQQTPHVHSWEDATCTAPKTCLSCGEVSGNALGHTWTEATYANPKTCTQCGITEGTAKALDIGTVLTLGTYEQDADPNNGEEPIEWIVLDAADGQALVITKNCIDTRPYHDVQNASATWESCSLRQWLNNDGYGFRSHFTPQEQDAILLTEVINPGSYDTWDHVFLLSVSEVERYFYQKGISEQTSVTLYAMKKGAGDLNSEKRTFWWTRTPGATNYAARPVSTEEIRFYSGDNVWCTDNTVRPAMWIDLSILDSQP